MTNLLNEEIRVITNTMSHLRRAIPLESDYGRKQKLRKDYSELDKILKEKLEQCGEYSG